MIFDDYDVIEFINNNDLDQKYAAQFISELKQYVNNKDKYDLSYDGNTINLTRKVNVNNPGLTYLEAPYFHKNITFNNLDIKTNPTKANLIRAYSENTHKGFYLYGKNGVGKTNLVVAIANHHYAKTKEKTLFIFLPDFIEKSKGFDKASSTFLNKVRYCDRLIIDDLGQESITARTRDDLLVPIITYRLERNLFTIVTSNYLVQEIKNLYTLRTIDSKKAVALSNKLAALCPQHSIDGEDYRK